jgi:hypothetical protein
MIEKNHSKFFYKCNIGSIYNNEWDNLCGQHCETFFQNFFFLIFFIINKIYNDIIFKYTLFKITLSKSFNRFQFISI